MKDRYNNASNVAGTSRGTLSTFSMRSNIQRVIECGMAHTAFTAAIWLGVTVAIIAPVVVSLDKNIYPTVFQ
jgi:hypothetical protein